MADTGLYIQAKTHRRSKMRKGEVSPGLEMCPWVCVSPSSFFPACFLLMLDSSALHGESERQRQRGSGNKLQESAVLYICLCEPCLLCVLSASVMLFVILTFLCSSGDSFCYNQKKACSSCLGSHKGVLMQCIVLLILYFTVCSSILSMCQGGIWHYDWLEVI